MTLFWKTIGGILIAAVLCIVLEKQGKDFSLVLTVVVCAMVVVSAAAYVQPIIDFLHKVEHIGRLQSDLVAVVFKAAGIGLGAEITSMICSDAGNQSLGKITQILGTTVIIYLSIPVFTDFLELIQQILTQV